MREREIPHSWKEVKGKRSARWSSVSDVRVCDVQGSGTKEQFWIEHIRMMKTAVLTQEPGASPG